MLTNAHTSAATANGSTFGFPPQPPSPVPPPAEVPRFADDPSVV